MFTKQQAFGVLESWLTASEDDLHEALSVLIPMKGDLWCIESKIFVHPRKTINEGSLGVHQSWETNLMPFRESFFNGRPVYLFESHVAQLNILKDLPDYRSILQSEDEKELQAEKEAENRRSERMAKMLNADLQLFQKAVTGFGLPITVNELDVIIHIEGKQIDLWYLPSGSRYCCTSIYGPQVGASADGGHRNIFTSDYTPTGFARLLRALKILD